ncbi:MAG: hypothetical protein ACRERD_33595 [Candidatus Binatia bacterium]
MTLVSNEMTHFLNSCDIAGAVANTAAVAGNVPFNGKVWLKPTIGWVLIKCNQ